MASGNPLNPCKVTLANGAVLAKLPITVQGSVGNGYHLLGYLCGNQEAS